ncbi:hypothetical protein BKA66DRAFT_592555 [Pyrenochaeta sp. MPI-SDFR-AT-0127]|nr:hypothetical protein BKA66DRAFT_592555 [Pyrenochaeta sp. MPI-SDFR-AT-0127]
MGIDAGFDMVPRLSKGIVDRHNWDRFISFIKNHYENDDQVEAKPNYILFKAGEYPKLPFEGHKFLRFSSNVSGSNARTTNVESYVDTVTRIAQVHFGSRARYWNDSFDQYGEYNWNEVSESIRSYEQADEFETHASIASFVTGNDPIKELGIPVFEVHDIPGKGRGLIARFNISKGTLILCEKPLITAHPMPLNDLERNLAAKLKALPKASQRQFLSLHNNRPGKFSFSNTFKTNALPCGPDSPIGGVYPTICLVNHSCIPNAHHSWDSKAKQETIYAIRPIKAGEEVTISYYCGRTSESRHTFLKEAFGFDCNCHGCSRPPSKLQDSDARLLLIQALDDRIGDADRVELRPEESLSDCQSLLQILEDEYEGYIGVLGARLYYDAYQTTRAMVPEGLDLVQFEKWLFARANHSPSDPIDFDAVSYS